MEAYSKEFRRDVLAACDAGGGTRDVANRFRVAESWVRRIKQQRRETGQVAPKTTRNRRRTWEVWADWLKAAVAQTPDAYLRELQARLKKERGIEVSENLISAACHALKLTRKKKRWSRPSKTAKTSPARGRSGRAGNRRSTPTAGSSSTKRGPKPT
jgi:transposase